MAALASYRARLSGRHPFAILDAGGRYAMLMSINGINLNVQVQGSGPPLVLLHGLTSNLTFMQREIDYFSRSYQTVAIDSRGHGRSDKPAEYTLQDHIDDVFGVLDTLHLDSIFLLGASMGSYVA